MSLRPGSSAFNDAGRTALLAALGVTESGALAVAGGQVLVVVPGFIRAPQMGEICPWTGLSGREFFDLRTLGVVLDGVEVMPPFHGWYADNEREKGRKVVHVNTAELLEYLQERTRIARERRGKGENGEMGRLRNGEKGNGE